MFLAPALSVDSAENQDSRRGSFNIRRHTLSDECDVFNDNFDVDVSSSSSRCFGQVNLIVDLNENDDRLLAVDERTGGSLRQERGASTDATELYSTSADNQLVYNDTRLDELSHDSRDDAVLVAFNNKRVKKRKSVDRYYSECRQQTEV